MAYVTVLNVKTKGTEDVRIVADVDKNLHVLVLRGNEVWFEKLESEFRDTYAFAITNFYDCVIYSFTEAFGLFNNEDIVKTRRLLGSQYNDYNASMELIEHNIPLTVKQIIIDSCMKEYRRK